MKITKICLFTTLVLSTVTARAINYNELTVYNYQTAVEHETEVENSTSVSSKDILRTSLEVTYGLTDKLEFAGYLDYEKNAGEKLEFKAFRLRMRTSLYEKGEMPIDTGLYFEAEFPQGSDEAYTVETKLILEKDIGRFTFVFSPALEYVRLKEKNSEDAISEIEKSYAAKVTYNNWENFQPHLDFISEIKDNAEQLLLAAVDFKLTHGFKASVGLGKSLNYNNNENLITMRLEYEFYQ